ncbi:MAG: TlpA family protein disulfide reductase [Gemmatimonadales bacterium]
MNLRGAWYVVLLGVLLAAPAPSVLVAQQEDQLGIAIGATPAPVTIEDLEGRPVDLGSYIGKRPVLIEFWATWCPLCAALLPRLEAAHRRFGDRVAFLVIGVAVNQTKNSMRRHQRAHPMSFPMLWDTEGRATRAFQAPSTSYVVVLDAGGKVVYTGLGEDQDIEQAVQKAVDSKGGR